MKLKIAQNYELKHDWICENGRVLAAQGEICTVTALTKTDATICVRGEEWDVALMSNDFAEMFSATWRLEASQILNNFRLLQELSSRNSYENYRAAVLEICDYVLKPETIKP